MKMLGLLTNPRFYLALVIAFSINLETSLSAQSGKSTQQTKKAKKTQAPQTPQDRRLSLDQVRKLVSLKTPDQIVAQEIRSRGIKEDYRKADITAIQQLGAGIESIQALRDAQPTATLYIQTEPGADVSLNGAEYQADSDGAVSVRGLEPGPYQISIRKPLFNPAIKSLTLPARETTSVSLPLTWAVGFLTVLTNTTTARIEIPGTAPQNGEVHRLPVRLGGISVQATAPWRIPASATTEIKPGKESTVFLSLEIDKSQIEALAAPIHAAFQRESYTDVIQLSRQYFDLSGSDPVILSDVALSHFSLHNGPSFQTFAMRVFDAGHQIRITVVHHHASPGARLSSTDLHAADLEFTRDSIGFSPRTQCNIAAFKLPYSEVQLTTQSSVFLGNGTYIPSFGLSIPDKANPAKRLQANFSIGHLPQASSNKKRLTQFFREDRDKVAILRQFLALLLRA